MRYRLLGSSGLRVSELCLGTMTFGSTDAWCADKRMSSQMFDAYVHAGGNFIDTADVYTGGESERLVGEFIKSDRERFVVSTKYTNAIPGRNDPNAAGNHRKNLLQSLDGSLRRMDLEYIDVYWLHIWEYTTPIEEVMRALDDAVRSGKILHVGFSGTPAWVASKANTIAHLRGWSPVQALQLEYNLVERSIEQEFIPMASNLGMSVLAWSPLASGILSGKYTREHNSGPKRLETLPLEHLDDQRYLIARTVDNIAHQIGVSSAQVALAWLRQRNILPIIGARTVEQLRDNLKCLNVTLSESQVAELDTCSQPSWGHPYNMLKTAMIRATAFGGMYDLIDSNGG